MINDDPRIIQVGSMYIITVAISGCPSDLRPTASSFSGLVNIHGGSEDYFIVSLLSHYWFDDELREKEIRVALEYIWNQLVSHGAVTGPMPEPVAGDPLDVLPKVGLAHTSPS